MKNVRRTFQRLLKNTEKDPELTDTQDWKNYNIAECLVNIKKSLDEVKPSSINACGRNLWPEVVISEKTTVNEIVFYIALWYRYPCDFTGTQHPRTTRDYCILKILIY